VRQELAGAIIVDGLNFHHQQEECDNSPEESVAFSCSSPLRATHLLHRVHRWLLQPEGRQTIQ